MTGPATCTKDRDNRRRWESVAKALSPEKKLLTAARQ